MLPSHFRHQRRDAHPYFLQIKTVGEPTAEFREGMHSKNVSVAWCMSLTIILVNFTDPFFARNSGNIFVSCGQREAVPGARMLMLHFLKKKRRHGIVISGIMRRTASAVWPLRLNVAILVDLSRFASRRPMESVNNRWCR